MRNTFAVFAQDAEIAAKALGSTLELTWSRQDETAVLAGRLCLLCFYGIGTGTQAGSASACSNKPQCAQPPS